MKEIKCLNCGANDFVIKDGYRVCTFCGTKYSIEKDELPKATTTIALNGDVQRLLDKCELEPEKAAKYANLILDIDPHNKEALAILSNDKRRQ